MSFICNTTNYISKMTKVAIFIFSIILTSVLFSCNKEDDKASGNCSDGYMNNGETGTDCGGPCSPCQLPIVERIVVIIKGKEVSFPNVFAEMATTGIIAGSNDTISFSVNFGRVEGLWPLIEGPNTFITYNGIDYTDFTSESHLILTEDDTDNNRISGLFRVEFYRLATSPDIYDTLIVNNGMFDNLSY